MKELGRYEDEYLAASGGDLIMMATQAMAMGGITDDINAGAIKHTRFHTRNNKRERHADMILIQTSYRW